VYRERLSFRFIKMILWFDWQAIAVAIALLCSPLLFMGFTIGVITFCLVWYAVVWVASVPRWNWTEDGMMYEMDADERAEWVFVNARFPKL
jgi:hypothetical protein